MKPLICIAAMVLATSLVPCVRAQDNGSEPDADRKEQKVWSGPTLKHRIVKGETLFDVADHFMGDPYKANLIAEMNGIEDPLKPPVGKTIDIPKLGLKLSYSVEKLNDDCEIGVDTRRQFVSGDRFHVRLNANEDGYLYLFSRNPDGIVRLFPEGETKRIHRFDEYVLPQEGWFRLDRQKGTEELLVLMSVRRLEDVDGILADNASATIKGSDRRVIESYFTSKQDEASSSDAMRAKAIEIEDSGDDDSGDGHTATSHGPLVAVRIVLNHK